MIVRVLSIWLALFGVLATTAQAQQGPLRIEITEGVIEPLPFAVPSFQPESGDAGQMAVDLARVVSEHHRHLGPVSRNSRQCVHFNGERF